MSFQQSLKKITVLGMAAGLLVGVLPANAATRPSSPDASSITIGIYQPPTYDYGNELNQVNNLTGKKHGIAMIYTDFSQPFSTYKFLIDQINNQMSAGDRPVMMISMGPVNGRQSLGCDRDYNGVVPPSSIIAGACDRYLAAFAQGMKSLNIRFLLNFAHEMNSVSQPWSPTNFGQPPSVFVQMYRKVKSVFDAQGATNIEWVWAPIYQSNPNTAANSPSAYYPGNEYVNWVAVSGYNYYNQMPSQYGAQPWNSFATIFDAILRDFACRYAKPQLINEFGSVDGGGSGKAAWITDAYAQMSNYPFLRGVVWYNYVDNAFNSIDFRITSNTAYNGSVSALPSGSGVWTNAYKSAVASGTFVTALPALKDVTPASTNCGVVNPNLKPRMRLPMIAKP